MLEGSLMITPVLKEFPGLRERFISSILSPDQTKNPWINDLQAAYRNSCRIATVERLTFTNFTLNDTDPNNYTAIEEQADSQCRITEEFLSEKLSEVQFRQAHYVRTAVYTFARALSQLLRRYCGSELGVCRNFRYKLNSHNIMSFSRRLLDELKQAAIAGNIWTFLSIYNLQFS